MGKQRHGSRSNTPTSFGFSQSKSSNQSPVAGFDFTSNMKLLCADIAKRMPELDHVDVDRVAFSFSQTRKRVSHGLQATLTPMRFEKGRMTEQRNGRTYAVQRLFDEAGREFLYILSFYMPRFMNTDFQEKLVTIFHELWHISPSFNGDLRRHPGRCYAHSHSQAAYDAEMGRLAKRYLSCSPPESVFSFLHFNFRELQNRYDRVYGEKIPHPKLIPLKQAAAPGSVPKIVES